jgi:hypothetical protein
MDITQIYTITAGSTFSIVALFYLVLLFPLHVKCDSDATNRRAVAQKWPLMGSLLTHPLYRSRTNVLAHPTAVVMS